MISHSYAKWGVIAWVICVGGLFACTQAHAQAKTNVTIYIELPLLPTHVKPGPPGKPPTIDCTNAQYPSASLDDGYNPNIDRRTSPPAVTVYDPNGIHTTAPGGGVGIAGGHGGFVDYTAVINTMARLIEARDMLALSQEIYSSSLSNNTPAQWCPYRFVRTVALFPGSMLSFGVSALPVMVPPSSFCAGNNCVITIDLPKAASWPPADRSLQWRLYAAAYSVLSALEFSTPLK